MREVLSSHHPCSWYWDHPVEIPTAAEGEAFKPV